MNAPIDQSAVSSAPNNTDTNVSTQPNVEMVDPATKAPTSTDYDSSFNARPHPTLEKTPHSIETENHIDHNQTAMPQVKCPACGQHNRSEFLLDYNGKMGECCAICVSIDRVKAAIAAYVVTNPPKPFHPQYKSTLIKEECDRLQRWVSGLRQLEMTTLSYKDIVKGDST